MNRPGRGNPEAMQAADGRQPPQRTEHEPVTRVAVEDLPRSFKLRIGDKDTRHARLLAQSFESLPPVLLHRQTMAVIDGAHRLLAAAISGHPEIPVRFFDGSEIDAFVEAVRLNTTHGKPLSLAERENAAQKLLTMCPDWSDRRVAEICGLSPKTVGSIRQSSSLDCRDPSGRVGRDGRVRPSDPVSRRMEIARLIVNQPDASNRSLATQVGTSQATVTDVRRRLQQGRSPVPERFMKSGEPMPDSGREASWNGDDPACNSTAEGRTFIDWFEAHGVDEETVRRYVDAVPLSRVYVVADEARRRASMWQQFASLVERRSGSRNGK